MPGRLEGETAVVVGAGQTPGSTIGNGRATAILFAREGAVVLCVDRDLASAAETVAMIEKDGGRAFAFAFAADIGGEGDWEALIEAKFITGALLPIDGGMSVPSDDGRPRRRGSRTALGAAGLNYLCPSQRPPADCAHLYRSFAGGRAGARQPARKIISFGFIVNKRLTQFSCGAKWS